jgi:hypothetical protein
VVVGPLAQVVLHLRRGENEEAAFGDGLGDQLPDDVLSPTPAWAARRPRLNPWCR